MAEPGSPNSRHVPSSMEDRIDSRPRLTAVVWTGVAIVAVFFGGFLGWAAFAPLQSAAIAPGLVSVDTNRKTIQHLEGGIVDQILVREGDRVSAGQILVHLDETAAQARLELLRAEVEAQTTQLALLGQEISGVQQLVKKGLAHKPRLLGLLRRKAELKGEQSRRLAEIRAAEFVLERSKIRASIDGTVVGLQVHTVGGVIGPGDPLMYIVPRDEPLIIEAKLDPLDIDVVHPDLLAEVQLTPYNKRNSLPVSGRVVSVSADSMTDEHSGQSYYLTRIELTQDPAEIFDGAVLYPGMPAEVIIITGERTVLDYFLLPLLRSVNRAFREN